MVKLKGRSKYPFKPWLQALWYQTLAVKFIEYMKTRKVPKVPRHRSSSPFWDPRKCPRTNSMTAAEKVPAAPQWTELGQNIHQISLWQPSIVWCLPTLVSWLLCLPMLSLFILFALSPVPGDQSASINVIARAGWPHCNHLLPAADLICQMLPGRIKI